MKDKAKKVYQDVNGNREEYFKQMLSFYSGLTLEEVPVFIDMLKRSKVYSINRYYRLNASEENKLREKEERMRREVSPNPCAQIMQEFQDYQGQYHFGI